MYDESVKISLAMFDTYTHLIDLIDPLDVLDTLLTIQFLYLHYKHNKPIEPFILFYRLSYIFYISYSLTITLSSVMCTTSYLTSVEYPSYNLAYSAKYNWPFTSTGMPQSTCTPFLFHIRVKANFKLS